MFVIGATKKLQSQLDKKIESTEEYKQISQIYQWQANIIKVNGRHCLILMNNKTALNLTLFGLESPQFENIDNVIKGSMNQLFQTLGIEETIAESMLEASKEIVYTKTSSRQTLGLMNEIKSSIEQQTKNKEYKDIDAVTINQKNNRMTFKALDGQTPLHAFQRYFED
ncbi:DUF6933 domain-containing protein [Halobacillus sp. K22]|uniref:DUF6933 domain-containing protein n=1 Tax=Halobacillus sp. K22 TaxID=3457431 RepID=UPI003FCDA2C9